MVVSLQYRPAKARIGVEMVKGRNMKVMAREMARGMPIGSHRNMHSVEVGVGLKAILPSWKMSGLG